MQRRPTIPDDVQVIMASMLSLREQFETNIPLIAYNCTGSAPKYSEKVLNLTCSLFGTWRTLSLIQAFGKERGIEKFRQVLEIMSRDSSGRPQKDELLSELFTVSENLGQPCVVPCSHYEEGVRNLFKQITAQDSIKIGKHERPVPSILIKREGSMGEYSYKGFIYVLDKKTFRSLLFPDQTPYYLNSFMNLKKTELSLFS
jgi:hypothetical protein